MTVEDRDDELQHLRLREAQLVRQLAVYARELRDLYHQHRAPVKDRREKIRRVRAALSAGAIEAALQPIADLWNGHVVGVEALARFRVEPARSPDVWFAEAAEVGLGVELELAAARAGLAAFAAAPEGAYLSLNFSPATICSEQFADLCEDVPLERLVIEVTEHAAVTDYEELRAALADLRRGGARLAVDDAGAGFASLQHILMLGPDIIKLDTTLTTGLDNDGTRRALAAALITFASGIGTSIVAEGIETPSELRALRDLGVSQGQGYLLARPAPVPPGGAVPARLSIEALGERA